MSRERGFQPKKRPDHYRVKDTSRHLTQMQEVDKHLSPEDEARLFRNSIKPPSLRRRQMDQLGPDEIAQQYPRRYEIYVEALREIRTGRNAAEMPKGVKYRSSAVLNEVRERVAHEKERRSEQLHWLAMMNQLDRYLIEESRLPDNEKRLRPRQLESMKKIQAHLEAGDATGFLTLPTGFGKTVMFIRLAEAMNARQLVVVPDKDLVEQTLQKYQRFTPKKEVAGISSDSRHGKKEGKDGTVITYESFRRRVADGTLDPSSYDTLILDEVHESLTDLREDPVSHFVREGVPVLGFTATDEYSHDKAVRYFLHKQIDHMSVEEAVQEKNISPFSVIVIEIDIDISSVALTSTGDYDERSMQAFFRSHPAQEKALHEALQQVVEQEYPDEKGFVFCYSSDEAAQVAEDLTAQGYISESLTYKTQRDAIPGMMFRFEEAGTQFLTGVSKITRGIDNPEATVALCLRPTQSPVKSVQRGGRALRYKPGKHAHIVEFQFADSRRQPMTFADAIGSGAQEVKRKRIDRAGKLRDSSEVDDDPIQVEDFDVAYDANQILEMQAKAVERLDTPFSFEDFDRVEDVMKEILDLLDDGYLDELQEVISNPSDVQQLGALATGCRSATLQLKEFHDRAMVALVYARQDQLELLQARYDGVKQLVEERVAGIGELASTYNSDIVCSQVDLIYSATAEA